ncbi:MAG: YihY/virulence factor BrkB family protein [Deltaproteobacteria bacterium]|nr:YihY/virulence factor BrkB family protein [Deltaproteobacteria bacterium]
MTRFLTEFHDFSRRRLWQDEGRGPGGLLALKCLRVLVLAGRGLIRNQSLVRSSALAYATILGFIPLFALLFAILQGIGVPRLLATYVMEHLAPGSREFATQILQYIEATQVTSLGVFGVVVLLLDLVIVMTNVEKAFNKTWQVSRTRPWSRKVSDYLSIFLIFPILMAVALTFSTSFWGLRYVIEVLSGIMPAIFFTATRWMVSLGLLWFAFIFIYLVMPNTQVNLWSAVLGGVVGGTVWQGAQWIFTGIQGASTYYNAIYGALYNLLFLFIWLFWCWLILLFGTEIAFAHQNLDGLTRQFRRPPAPPEPVDEYLCLAALVSIGARFFKRQPPLSRDELSRMLPRGNNLADRVTQALQDSNLVVEVAPDRPGSSPQFLPKLPLNQVTVKEVLDGLRESRGAALDVALAGEPRLIALLKPLAEATDPAGGEALTLQQLVEAFAGNGPETKD